jgi:hypothetical protein
VVVVAEQIGMKRRGAITRGREDYFVFVQTNTIVIPGHRIAMNYDVQ